MEIANACAGTLTTSVAAANFVIFDWARNVAFFTRQTGEAFALAGGHVTDAAIPAWGD